MDVFYSFDFLGIHDIIQILSYFHQIDFFQKSEVEDMKVLTLDLD